MTDRLIAPGRIVHVGLTQMACSADPAANLANQVRLVEQAAAAGANVIATQEMFRSQYFCQTEDHRFFQLAESIPGPSTDALGKIAKRFGVVVVASLFERRAAGLYHNTAAVLDTRRQRSSASTARCTSPTTRSTTRSSTSPPATSGSKPSHTTSPRIGDADLLGPVVPGGRAR